MALPEISRSMLKNSLVLGLFAILTVGLVAITEQGTAERIALAERDAKSRALSELLPAGSYDNHLQDTLRRLHDPSLGSKASPAYLATLDGKPAAVILQVTTPEGYSGSIDLLVGILADGRLAGVRVIRHKETPGLGDKIELAKSDWIRSFAGKSLDSPADGWAVKKDGGQFDQFAGATITPRAVVKAVHQALQYFDAHQAELLMPQEPAHDLP
ncbi:electron transport complex subunit RsxG [Pseudomonas sp. N040]|uniref:electron transport complex subunit RsxG n=1 Tax=Pseudomonas sp. N040 TaxID=2785325 RepID=UPI0018A25A74|nr:electron transport complex subunit RsxG [Pseudomonas sp. N040]MBW7013407.1 electron transport complex subunit RsxG [Pseudomonas sp. N040]